MTILHRNFDHNQGMKHNDITLKKKLSYSDVSPMKQMRFKTNLKVMSFTLQRKTLHVASNIPMRSTSSLARLLTRCACFAIATCSCCHKSVGLHSIVTEHRVTTHHFVPFLHLCILFLGMHSSSRSRTRDTTLIRGLNHGWNGSFIKMEISGSMTLLNDLPFLVPPKLASRMPQQACIPTICSSSCKVR